LESATPSQLRVQEAKMKWPLKSLFLVVLLAATPGRATETTSLDSLRVQADIPRQGDFLGFGFGSLWMMSGIRLVRVDASNNSVSDIQLESAKGPYRGIGVGEGAVWVPDCGSNLIYKVDPHTNIVVKEISAELYNSNGSMVSVKAPSGWLRSGVTRL
jgi:hypothetical protein